MLQGSFLTPDVFLCEMKLPRDHGYPVRVILPGHAGCRQAKWVHKVRLLFLQQNSVIS